MEKKITHCVDCGSLLRATSMELGTGEYLLECPKCVCPECGASKQAIDTPDGYQMLCNCGFEDE